MRLFPWQGFAVVGVVILTVFTVHRDDPMRAATVATLVIGGSSTAIAYLIGVSDVFLALLVPTVAAGTLLSTIDITTSAMRWAVTLLVSAIAFAAAAWRITVPFRLRRTFASLLIEDLAILLILTVGARIVNGR